MEWNREHQSTMNSPVHNSYAAKKPAAPFRVESEKKPKRETAKERQARYISRIDKDSLEALNQDLLEEIERLKNDLKTQINVTNAMRNDDEELRWQILTERTKRMRDPLFVKWVEQNTVRTEGTEMQE